MIEIEGPDGVIYEFPEGTSEDVMRNAMVQVYGAPKPAVPAPSPSELASVYSALEQRAPSPEPWKSASLGLPKSVPGALVEPRPGEGLIGVVDDSLRSFAAGVPRGAAQLAGLPGTIGDMLDAGVTGAINYATGSELQAPKTSLSGGKIQGLLGDITGGATEYRGEGFIPRAAGTIGEFVGGGAGMKMGAAMGLGSEAAGYMTEDTWLEPLARIGGALAAGGLASLGTAWKNGKEVREFIEAAPATAALKKQADDLYDAARQLGVTAKPSEVVKLGDDLKGILREEGAITPKGNMAGSYPKVADAVRLVDDFSGAPMTAKEMLQARKAFTAAARSADPSEARLGSIMIQKFDDFTSTLAPQIAEANAVYRTMSQGKLIEKTIELAGSKAGQFSGSGFENALRTEMRALERQVIKGKLKVSPDELALITRISRGGVAENIARDIGKAAPRGVVSAGMGGGVPFAVGSAIGGPGLGTLMGAGTLAGGEIGRRIATAMQTRNADLLSAIARSGGALPNSIKSAAPALPQITTGIPGLLAQ